MSENNLEAMSEDHDDGADLEWVPPSEAEQKVLNARRERSDKISKRMGDYLLKGYKMLATTCRICGTIDLEDKQGRKYCVACEEIDCEENSKDNPAVNAQAARNQIAEGRLEEMESQVEEPVARVESQVEEPVVRVQHVSQRNANPTLSMNRSNGLIRLSGGGASSLPSQPVSVIHSGLDSVFSKLDSASQSLMETQDIETSRQLVLLIKDCADCLLSLKNAAVAHQ